MTLDLVSLGFDGAIPADTGRPAYHPAILLKSYIYGYLNRIQSSRRLEREVQRNVELMWLTGRLIPDFKTIANLRKDNSKAIRGVCRQFRSIYRAIAQPTKVDDPTMRSKRFYTLWAESCRSRTTTFGQKINFSPLFSL
jgi:hypothetical protein